MQDDRVTGGPADQQLVDRRHRRCEARSAGKADREVIAARRHLGLAVAQVEVQAPGAAALALIVLVAAATSGCFRAELGGLRGFLWGIAGGNLLAGAFAAWQVRGAFEPEPASGADAVPEGADAAVCL